MFAQEIKDGRADRASRPLARGRHAVGVPARRRALPGALRRLGRGRRATGSTARHAGTRTARSWPRPTTWWSRAMATDHVSTLRLWKAVAPAAHRPQRLQHRRLRPRGAGEERVREHLLGALPERQHPCRTRTAPAPGVLLRRRLAAGPDRPAPRRARRPRQPRRQGCHPPQRHPSGDRRRRADAAAVRRPRHALARGLVALHPDLLVHQPHPDARGARDLAGRADAARPAAAPQHHLSHQPGDARPRDGAETERCGSAARACR